MFTFDAPVVDNFITPTTTKSFWHFVYFPIPFSFFKSTDKTK